MQRRDFLRNTLMAFAVSLVPKILQPSIPEIPKLISGWVVIAKEMLKDIPFLESYLPTMIKHELSKNDGYDSNKEIEIQMSDEHADFFVKNIVLVVGTQVV